LLSGLVHGPESLFPPKRFFRGRRRVARRFWLRPPCQRFLLRPLCALRCLRHLLVAFDLGGSGPLICQGVNPQVIPAWRDFPRLTQPTFFLTFAWVPLLCSRVYSEADSFLFLVCALGRPLFKMATICKLANCFLHFPGARFHYCRPIRKPAEGLLPSLIEVAEIALRAGVGGPLLWLVPEGLLIKFFIFSRGTRLFGFWIWGIMGTAVCFDRLLSSPFVV